MCKDVKGKKTGLFWWLEISAVDHEIGAKIMHNGSVRCNLQILYDLDLSKKVFFYFYINVIMLIYARNKTLVCKPYLQFCMAHTFIQIQGYLFIKILISKVSFHVFYCFMGSFCMVYTSTYHYFYPVSHFETANGIHYL